MNVLGDSDLRRLQAHLSLLGVRSCPDSTLRSMIHASFWLGIERFEGRVLRPVFRWPETSLTAHAASILKSPVQLNDSGGIRRLAAAWESPRKLLVKADESGGQVMAMALEAGLWSGDLGVIVESIRPGLVLVSSYGSSVASISQSGLELVPDPLNNNFKSKISQAVAGAPALDDAKLNGLQMMVTSARNSGVGGIFLLARTPAIEGGIQLSTPWGVVGHYRDLLVEQIRRNVANETTETGSVLHVGYLWRRATEAWGMLAGTDGAILLDTQLRLHAFGVHLKVASEPVDYEETTVMDPEVVAPRTTGALSGTRHAASIHHVHASANTFALVVSHDGPVSLVTKNGSRVRVTRRFEVLLPTLDG